MVLAKTHLSLGFRWTDGHKIDLHDLLIGYDPVTSAITDFVHVTARSSNAVASVDADGTGADSTFVQIVTLIGLSSLTGTKPICWQMAI